jgi:hypothetical protein
MRVLTARRAAGCIAAVSVALFAAALALIFADRHLVPAGLSGWDFSDVFGGVTNLAVPAVGFVLASWRPANRVGWLFLVAGLALALGGVANTYGLHALVAAPGSLPAARAVAWLSGWIWVIPLAMLAFVFLLFPTGQLRSRRWRPAAWLVGGAFAFTAVVLLVHATRFWADPFSPASREVTTGAGSALFVVLPAALVVGVAAVVVRFARSAGEERLQLKWFAAAAVFVVATLSTSMVTSSVAANVLSNVAFLCLWVAIAISVLKYRLYEIDRIISRTLAYAIVTGLLVGVYAGLVLLATHLLEIRSPIAVAASTLAAAAMFSPLRGRVQRVVERRFNRTRYDADQIVAAFAVHLKDAVDLDSVRDDLAAAVSRALEPAHVSVWVRQQD